MKNVYTHKNNLIYSKQICYKSVKISNKNHRNEIMKFKKLSLLILAVLIIIAGVVSVQYFTGINSQSNYNSQTAGSVVYIENGVSGVVTINDPFLKRTTAITVIYYPLDTGTGFMVTKNGYIITALHVVGDS